jgi:hypothetical protein
VLQELRRHSGGQDDISPEGLEECFKSLFDRFGMKLKPGESAMIAKKFETCRSRLQRVLEMCRAESNRSLWLSAGRKLRHAVQRATLTGVDVEQVLADFDVSGEGSISPADFREFMKSLSGSGKWSPEELSCAVRHFSRVREAEGPGDRARVEHGVSLAEVCAFLGLRYVGNIPAAIRKCLLTSLGTADPQVVADKLAEQAGRLGVSSRGLLSLESVEQLLVPHRVFDQLSVRQLRDSLRRRTAVPTLAVSLKDLLTWLKLPAQSTQRPDMSELAAFLRRNFESFDEVSQCHRPCLASSAGPAHAGCDWRRESHGGRAG